MGARVLLHVGTPKTATTFFQDILFRHRLVLAERGVHYPGATVDMQFRASLDLIRREWGGLEDEVVGDWDALAAEVRSESGTHIVSCEILAGATPEQARRALSSFGDAEIHLVLTVRDLFRQIPAEWQETVKHFGTETYADFLAAIRTRSGRSADLFWGVQDLSGILERWAGDLPPERVHLVTLPPRGTDPSVLWKRLETAFGLDGFGLPSASDRANESMGANATSFVRGLNEQTPAFLSKPEYRWLVMEFLSHRTLAQRKGKRRISVPPGDVPWVAALSAGWVDQLRGAGYDVVGELEELLGEAPVDFVDPDRPDPERVASIATNATLALLEEAGRLMRERDALRAEVEQLREVAGVRNAVRGVSRRVYRRVRGSSSRRA
ncbi:MAG: hypothetical protein QM572_10200 [Nocardioides sp.]|uniref:hypothetical protein n=1 Tax=Nocardioides sp. TaxID=35761 RepID=UPI0039E4506D